MQEKSLKRALDMLSAANTLTLPMDVHRLVDHFECRTQVYSRSVHLLENFNLNELAAEYPALSTKRWGKYYIFLSDDLNAEQERFAIAHELGHIAMGHLEPDAEELSKEESENQADLFALLLLAPPPVLEAYDIDTPENIRQLTGLSLNHSRMAYGFLLEYRRQQHEAARQQDITRRARLAARPAPIESTPAPAETTAATLLLPVTGKAVG